MRRIVGEIPPMCYACLLILSIRTVYVAIRARCLPANDGQFLCQALVKVIAGPHKFGRCHYPHYNMLRHEGYRAYLRTTITGTTISFVG
jgi:hypothetical protein